MDNKEIFQNMTKGEWTHHDGSIYAGDKSAFSQLLLARSGMVTDTESKANAELIVRMKRETIGKGINPESVGKMRLYAELEEKFQNGEVFEYNGNKYKRSVNKVEAVALLNKLRTEALTASKLQP